MLQRTMQSTGMRAGPIRLNATLCFLAIVSLLIPSSRSFSSTTTRRSAFLKSQQAGISQSSTRITEQQSHLFRMVSHTKARQQPLFADPLANDEKMDDEDSSSSTTTSSSSTSFSKSLHEQSFEPMAMITSKKGLLATLAVTAVALAPQMAHAVELSAASATNLLSSVSQTGFYQAFSLVFLSEIGDKTFFIAGLLAMKTSRLVSFLGSMAALAAMTVISVLIGQIFHAIPSGIADGVPLDDIAAVLAFLFFGFKTLQEALAMNPEEPSAMDEELADAEDTVQNTDVSRGSQLATIFALVFAAELGDRSFLSTIALSAAQAPVSVAAGAIAAHAVATGIAVFSGSVVAKYLSERVIGLIGGTLFIAFAITTALGIF